MCMKACNVLWNHIFIHFVTVNVWILQKLATRRVSENSANWTEWWELIFLYMYRLGQKFLDKFFGWRNFGEMFVFRAQNLSGATSEPPTKYSQNILVIIICVPRQCFPIDAQLTITKKQVYAVESTMSRSGNSAALPAIRVGMAL